MHLYYLNIYFNIRLNIDQFSYLHYICIAPIVLRSFVLVGHSVSHEQIFVLINVFTLLAQCLMNTLLVLNLTMRELHSRDFFLVSFEDLPFLISADTIVHIFGPIEFCVSSFRSVVLFLRLSENALKEKIHFIISNDKLFLTLIFHMLVPGSFTD